MITEREFAGLMVLLSNGLGATLSAIGIQQYYGVISEKGYEYHHVLSAKDAALRTCRYFPKPVELLDLCAEARAKETRKAIDRARTALPAKPAEDSDPCGETDEHGDTCTLTVGDHRKAFAALVERIGMASSEITMLRPSYLEQRRIHPPRPGVELAEEPPF